MIYVAIYFTSSCKDIFIGFYAYVHAYIIINLEYICNINKHQADFSTIDINEIQIRTFWRISRTFREGSKLTFWRLQHVLNPSDVYRTLLRIALTFKIPFRIILALQEHPEESFWHLKAFGRIILISGEHPEHSENLLTIRSDIQRPFTLLFRHRPEEPFCSPCVSCRIGRNAITCRAVKWNRTFSARQGISSSKSRRSRIFACLP